VLQTCFIIKLKEMEKNQTDIEKFDEEQSFQVIQEMIRVSQKKVRSDDILLIVWEYAITLTYLVKYCIEVYRSGINNTGSGVYNLVHYRAGETGDNLCWSVAALCLDCSVF
jgi:hypothetical protein